MAQQRGRAAMFGGMLTTALLAAALTASPAGASDEASELQNVPETYVDKSGVVHYEFDKTEMPGASLTTEQVELTDDGVCNFSASGSGGGSGQAAANNSDGPTITVGSEVSFNPNTCERVMATASYPLEDAPAAVLDTLEVPEGMDTDSQHSGSGDIGAAATTWYGELNARIEDPVGIHVSSTTSEHTWGNNGAVDHYHRWGWYTPTGWSRTDYDATNSYYYTDTTGHFTNLIFCNPFADTQTFHNLTIFRGYDNGRWSWDYSMNKNGGDGDCSGLLSYHYTVVTP